VVSLATIVEGEGEVEAVPVLLRRILHEMAIYDIDISRPFRVKRYQIVREGEIERAVQQVMRDRANVGGVLVILDSDDDCPARLGPQLRERCQSACPSIPAAVVLAHREFESWFLGAKESLRGRRGIRSDAVAPDNPEEIRGVKEHLTRNMQPMNRYLEVDDQPAFVERMDLNMARRRCPSFDKLFREVENLVRRMRKTAGHEQPR